VKGLSVNREELKRMIDKIPEQDALEVYDFIEFLNSKREKESLLQLDVDNLAVDENLILQIENSRVDRNNGRFYTKEQGLEYLRKRFEES
jgi:aspartate carbamoyltransferase regulatory subunit